jgi:hypothetical protein
MAKVLGLTDVAGMLNENLNEEVNAAKKILAAGHSILKEAASEPEQEKKPKSGKEKYSDKKSKEDEKKAAPDIKRQAS